MRDINGVDVFYYCKCGLFLFDGEWRLFSLAQAREEIKKRKTGRLANLIRKVCPKCLAAKK